MLNNIRYDTVCVPQQEPVSLYGDTKFFSLAKLDRMLNPALIKKFIDEEEAK